MIAIIITAILIIIITAAVAEDRYIVLVLSRETTTVSRHLKRLHSPTYHLYFGIISNRPDLVVIIVLRLKPFSIFT